MFSRIVIGLIIVIIAAIIFMGGWSLHRVSTVEPCPEGQVHILARNGIFCVTGAPAK